MPSLALSAVHLGKVYPGSKSGTPALADVNLQVPTGRVYGLIGRNGAGKTTFVRIAATQLALTSGSLEVLGLDVKTQAREIRCRIACVPQEARPLYFLNTEEVVYLYLKMRGMEPAEARRRTRDALEELSLTEYAKKLVARLSGGLRRRTLCAMVLASDAEVLFLDEPTTGLDPLARREVWKAVRRTIREHRTILLTTHYLDEAEALSSRLGADREGPAPSRGHARRPAGPRPVSLPGDGAGSVPSRRARLVRAGRRHRGRPPRVRQGRGGAGTRDEGARAGRPRVDGAGELGGHLPRDRREVDRPGRAARRRGGDVTERHRLRSLWTFVVTNGVIPIRTQPLYLVNLLASPLSFLFFITIVSKGALVPYGITGGMVLTMLSVGTGLQSDLTHYRHDLKFQDIVVASPVEAPVYVAGMALSELVYSLPGLAVFVVLFFTPATPPSRAS